MNVARFLGDPAGYRYDAEAPFDKTRAGRWTMAQRGISGQFAMVDLDKAYLIESELDAETQEAFDHAMRVLGGE